MFRGIDPKQLEKAMKKMGVKQESIESSEVIIKCKDKEIIILNPHVVKVNMMGEESLQITGDIQIRPVQKYTEEDIKTVMEKAECSEEKAKESLEKNEGNIAAAILELTQ